MKKNINGPAAAVIIVVAALLLIGVFYMRYMHETTLSGADAMAKLRADAARMKAGGSVRVPNTGAQSTP